MSKTKWTNEQQAVIDSRNGNLLVAAAAGSGKTAVLVERIIQMITDKENPIDINRLLVVTFTNAAAAEMKERVQAAIEKLIQTSESNELLQRQLVLLNDAKITTIHSFCLNVIENYHHLIPIEPNFRIATEQECSLFKLQALDLVFDNLYKTDDTDFLELVKLYGNNRNDSTLRELILGMYNFVIASPTPHKWLDDATEALNVTDNFSFLETEYGKSLINTISIILEGVDQSFELIINQTQGIPELHSYYIRYVSEQSQVKKIISNLNNGWDDIKESIELVNYENYQKGMKRVPSTADEYIKELKTSTKALRDECKETIDNLYSTLFYRTQDDIINEYKILYPNVKTMSRICKDFISMYEKLKRDSNVIDFNDIEHFALNILTTFDKDKGLVPTEIASEYADLFDEIFIDEYQDSSLTQEVILKSISKNFNNRFMVGDVKQSIYKFRQARPDIFLEKYNSYAPELNEHGKKILLHKNFRSRKEVLDATNFIFEHIMSEELGGLEYGETERLNLGGTFKPPTESINYGGPSEIHLIHKDKGDVDSDADVKEDTNEDLDKIQIEARVLANIIKDITDINSDKVLNIIDKHTGKYRPTQYSDIVILLRSTTNWENIITNELVKFGIPVSSQSSSKYFDNYEVKAALVTLMAFNDVFDDIALTGALRTSVFNFSIDELIAIRANNRKAKLYIAIKEYVENFEDELSSKCNDALNKIEHFIEIFKINSLEKSIYTLFEETGMYLFSQGMNNGDIRKRNLDLFLQRAKAFEETNSSELSDFLEYIKQLIDYDIELPSALNSSKNSNTVKIMTIHKSKGLEFPVVICAGLGKKFNNLDLRNTILTHSDLGYGPQIYDYEKGITYPSIMKESIKSKMLIENLSEEMRVLYVALTRPKEKLYLVGMTDDIEKSLNKWASYAKEDSKIPKYAILKSNNYLDWIIPSTLKHPNLHDVRNTYRLDDIPVSIHDSKWTCKIWSPNDIRYDYNDVEDSTGDNKSGYEELTNIKEYIKCSKHTRTDNISIPQNVSVTGSFEMNKKPVLIQPSFIRNNERVEISAMDRGSIVHEFLYRLDFNKVHSLSDIDSQLSSLITKGIFTNEEANLIPTDKIHTFFNSELGQRLVKSNRIKREQEISAYLPAGKITGKETDNSKSIFVKGIVDIYFEEDDEIIIIDYKTDNVESTHFEQTLEQYKKQVSLYKDILETITNKKVKESYLYLLSDNKYVSINF